MSDTGTQTGAPDENSGPKELREALARHQAENETLKAQLTQLTDAAREQSFTLAGIPNEGVGRLLRTTYEGPVDVEEMQKYAAEYGFEPNQSSSQPQTSPEETQPVVPDANLGALASIQSARGADPVPSNENAVLDGLEKLKLQVMKGEASMKDLEGYLGANKLLA